MSLPLSRLRRTRLGLELLEDRCVPASAFSYDSMTQALTITGSTTSTNQFSYDQRAVNDPVQGTYYRVTFTMNGETQQYVAGNGGDVIVPGFSTVSHVTAFGNGAGDTAILTVNDAFDNGSGQLTYLTGGVVLGPRGGELLNQANGTNGPPVDFMDLNNFPTTYIYFTNGLRDTAQLLDSPNADDLFVSVGNFAYMKNGLNNSSAYFNLVSGAASVYSYSSNATDQAYHYVPTSFLPVSFVSSGSAYSYTSGTDDGYRSFFDVAVGFKFNYGIASGTTAIAYIIDSPGDDVFSGNADYFGSLSSSYLYSTDSAGDLTLFNEAVGFNTVYAQSFVGGTDFAYNNAPSHNILGGAWILLT
jgi:hypothetical protein